MDFCTLGMFIIDDIYPAPSDADQTPHLSIPGGAGTYCAVGARILSSPPSSRRVGWIVDCGSDFPPDLLDAIQAWQTGVLLRSRTGLTTRGWNGYSANEHRDFKYLTPKIRLAEKDLSDDLLASKSFHMVCSQARCKDLTMGIMARRKEIHPHLEPPIFVYEPVPDAAVPSALRDTYDCLSYVSVISPNHSELASIFDRKAEVHKDGLNRTVVEDCAAKLLDHASRSEHELKVVVRAGADGCYVATTGETPIKAWLPAYHASTQAKVVDPTGGGNAFLGGFAIGMVKTGDVLEAAKWGSISASFCIEQVGIPVMSVGDDGIERWNGINVKERLAQFEERCHS